MSITAIASFAALLLSAPPAAMPLDAAPTLTAPAPRPMAVDGGELITLLEHFAAPHFGLSTDEVWYAYEVEKSLTIDELGDRHYRIAYGDGILDVVLEDSNI